MSSPAQERLRACLLAIGDEVLRGEVTLIVGGSEVTLYPGDSVVQQPGVPHDWQNRSAETGVMVGVLISARK